MVEKQADSSEPTRNSLSTWWAHRRSQQAPGARETKRILAEKVRGGEWLEQVEEK